MSKTIIGVTGPSGGGKSTFCDVFASLGFIHINADKIYHTLLNDGVYNTELKEAFGDSIFNGGKVDRKALAAIVFKDKAKLKRLGEITHKKVDDEIWRRIEISNKAVLDIPLLYESGVDFNCTEIYAVIADRDMLIKRAMKRDNLTIEDAKKRIDNQKTIDYYRESGATIILNDRTEDEFIEKVKELAKRYE